MRKFYLIGRKHQIKPKWGDISQNKYLKTVKVTKNKKKYWNHDRLEKMKYDEGPGLDLEPEKTEESEIWNKVWFG